MDHVLRLTPHIRYINKMSVITSVVVSTHHRLTCMPFRELSANKRWTLDKSKVPQLDEKDLDEKFISGSGPGGQSVNKSVNCCQLRHKPSGILVKVHHRRRLDDNRKIARELIIEKLDDMINGEDSLSSQKKRIALEKRAINATIDERRRAMKEEFKKLQITQQRPDST